MVPKPEGATGRLDVRFTEKQTPSPQVQTAGCYDDATTPARCSGSVLPFEAG